MAVVRGSSISRSDAAVGGLEVQVAAAVMASHLTLQVMTGSDRIACLDEVTQYQEGRTPLVPFARPPKG